MSSTQYSVLSTQAERVPPQSVELEMCVLGGIMIEPEEAYSVAADYLSRDSFYLDGHGLIFERMGGLHRRGIPPDANAVVDELRQRGEIDKVGGSGVVMGMINSVPTGANVEWHAKKIAELALLRGLIRGCTRIIDQAYTQALPAHAVAENAWRELEGYLGSGKAGTVRISAALEVEMEMIERATIARSDALKAGQPPPSTPRGLPTGLADLDWRMGGLRPGEMTILAARPSRGKTSLGLCIARHLAVLRDLPLGIVSLEQNPRELAGRMLAMGTWDGERGITVDEMYGQRELGDEDWLKMTKAYQATAGAPVHVVESGDCTIGHIRSEARRLRAREGIELFVVDYLQLVVVPGQEAGVRETTAVSRSLKQLARELNIPFIVMSQLSRAPESRAGKRPQLSDLRESGAIEQDADVVVFIHSADRDRNDRKDWEMLEVLLIVEKNRNGATGTVKVRFVPEVGRFVNATR